MQTNPKVPTDTNLIARKAVEGLQQSIRAIYRLHDSEIENKISLNFNDQINYRNWLYIQSFMARKLNAVHLGQTDYDNDVKDLKFSFIYKTEPIT